MSNFFDKSDLTRKDVDEIVSETLKNSDDGELYLEDSKSESILLDDKDFIRLRRKKNKIITLMYSVVMIMFIASMSLLSKILLHFTS